MVSLLIDSTVAIFMKVKMKSSIAPYWQHHKATPMVVCALCNQGAKPGLQAAMAAAHGTASMEGWWLGSHLYIDCNCTTKWWMMIHIVLFLLTKNASNKTTSWVFHPCNHGRCTCLSYRWHIGISYNIMEEWMHLNLVCLFSQLCSLFTLEFLFTIKIISLWGGDIMPPLSSMVLHALDSEIDWYMLWRECGRRLHACSNSLLHSTGQNGGESL